MGNFCNVDFILYLLICIKRLKKKEEGICQNLLNMGLL